MPTDDRLTIITDIEAFGTTMGAAIEMGIEGDCAINGTPSKAFTLCLTPVDLESPDETQVSASGIYRDSKWFSCLFALS